MGILKKLVIGAGVIYVGVISLSQIGVETSGSVAEMSDADLQSFVRDQPGKAHAICLRGSLDGSMPDVVLAMKYDLNDPNSFEHVQTRATTPDETGKQSVRMKYRATNGFGAKMLGEIQAEVNIRGCHVIKWRSI